MSKIDCDDVPVTGAFLSLVKALHGARDVFVSESAMAADLGLDMPQGHWPRSRELFFERYQKQVRAIGLVANEQTFEALMRIRIPEDAWRTDFSELPKRFVFNPWLGQGYGGIKVVG